MGEGEEVKSDGWACFRASKKNEAAEVSVLELEREVEGLQVREDVVTTPS